MVGALWLRWMTIGYTELIEWWDGIEDYWRLRRGWWRWVSKMLGIDEWMTGLLDKYIILLTWFFSAYRNCSRLFFTVQVTLHGARICAVLYHPCVVKLVYLSVILRKKDGGMKKQPRLRLVVFITSFFHLNSSKWSPFLLSFSVLGGGLSDYAHSTTLLVFERAVRHLETSHMCWIRSLTSLTAQINSK